MAKEIILELEAKTDKALKEIQGLTAQVENLTKALEDNSKKSAKGFKGMIQGLKNLKVGFGSIMKGAAVFTLISKAVDKFTEILKENQFVADTLAMVFETINQVFTQVVNALTDAYKRASEATGGFDALGKVLKNLLTLALTPLKLTFYGLKLGIQEVQYAWEKWINGADPERLAELDAGIQATKDSLSEVATKAVEAGKGISENIGEAIGEVVAFGEAAVENLEKVSVAEAAANAKAKIELQNRAALNEAINARLLQQYDQEAEKLRQIRDDVSLSIEERIEANNKLKGVLEEQERVMLANAGAAVELARQNLAVNNTIENQIALEQALTEQADIRATATGFASEQKINEVGLAQELLDLTSSQSEADAIRLIEGKRADAELIESALLKLEVDRAILLEERAIEKQRLQDKVDSYKEGTQARVDAENELKAFLQQSKKDEVALDRDISREKVNVVMGAMGAIAGLVGENTAFGKAVAVSQAIMDTYAGANKAFAQGGIFGAIGAAGIIASGLANVRKILSTEEPEAPSFAENSPKSSGGASVAAPSLPPEFNIVGSSGSSQIAEAIGSQNKKPMKAYVVSKDVSTAQELDRNIEGEAKFG